MLTPLGWLYGKIINARNSFYENNRLKSFSLGVPTISIGNITVGGTGKTPLVAFVAEILSEKGEKVCIISRGYKRENENKRVLVSDGEKILADVREAGDEPFELANKLLGKVFVMADANRVEAGLWAKEKFGITAFVLDDAFQHLKVKRDLNIVTIDATNPFGNDKTLPAGILREPLENLNRADLIIITRANLSEEIQKLKLKIKNYNPNCPIITASNEASHLTELKDFNKILTTHHLPLTTHYLAFCALGNPENFFKQLRIENFKLIQTINFPDHHFYNQKDIENLEASAQNNNANAFIITAKDAVKLKDLDFSLPCYVAHSKLVFDDEKKLREMIYAVFG
ncbi:MAG: tetraacyldisaccharide 4'-kinase [Aridibacter sp.]